MLHFRQNQLLGSKRSKPAAASAALLTSRPDTTSPASSGATASNMPNRLDRSTLPNGVINVSVMLDAAVPSESGMAS